MKLPRGRLVRRRVVSDLATPLSNVLDDELTGYARLESQDALLLDADGAGVLTFEDGIPMVAYHTGTDNGGTGALSDIAVAGPYRLELYELDPVVLAEAHETENLLVPPGMPAEQLAGDTDLVERTHERAPANRLQADDENLDAVASFLDDEDAIGRLQNRARDEARERADDWGFDVHE